MFRWVQVTVISAALSCSLVQQGDAKQTKSVQVFLSDQQAMEESLETVKQLSVNLTVRAIEELNEKELDKAIKDCYLAINYCPMNDTAYMLLTVIYLMTGQEQKIYDVLTLAGRSYPDFDNIVGNIDDQNLGHIPLNESDGSIFLANFPENKKMAISFMFDDGETDVYKALPTFEKYGFRATIPVIAGIVDDNDDNGFWGSWKEWKDAADRGFEIANHSMFHRNLMKLHGDDYDTSIDQAKEIIERNTGHKVTAFIFPYDSYSSEALRRALRSHEAVRAPEVLNTVYKRTLTIVYGGPRFSIKAANRLVDIAAERHLWLLAECHGVSKNRTMRSFKSITPDFLEAHLAYIHSKADDIWVDTFSHVFEYLLLRTKTKVKISHFTSDTIDFVLHQDGPQVKLSVPLTVIIKTEAGASFQSATSADGRALKAWVCAADKLCIDVDSYENVHVQWKNPSGY
jgi:peptidoglycan/xylan/chitin deacetylase (PgdA/CDA1 family)